MDTRTVNKTGQLADVGTSQPSPTGTSKARKAARSGSATTAGLGVDSSRQSAPARSDWNVSLSPEAQQRADAMKKARDIARATPDVREDRVRELKEKIAKGEYQVESGQVADAMLAEAIRERLAETSQDV